MKNKSLNLIVAGIFAFVFLISLASASVNFTGVTGASQTANLGDSISVKFSLVESGVNNITGIVFTNPVILNYGSHTLTSNSISGVITSLNKSQTSSEMTLTFNIPSNQTLGTYSGTLSFTGSNGTLDAQHISIIVKSDKPSEILDCINTGMPSNTDVRIKKIDFTNNGIAVGSSFVTYGDENSWFPFEDIEVEIEVKNYGAYDVSDVEVSWGLWNEDAREWVIEPDSEKSFDIDHGDSESLTVNFQLDNSMDMDLEDMSDGDTLRFYVYLSDGAVDDNDSPDDGKDFCDYDSSDADLVIERNFVVVTDVTIPETANCDSTLQISGTLWNVGDKDQDSVSILVTNSQLGLNKQVQAGDIDSLDSANFNFNLDLGESVETGTYYLKFVVLDEDKDIYENDFDDDESVLNFPLILTGDCSVPTLEISASLVDSEIGIAGKPLVVKTTLVNSGTKTATYSINAAGYASWANSAQIDQPLITLDAGESKAILITLDIKSDAVGEQTFNIEVLSGNKLVADQPVSVPVEKRVGLSSIINKDNWHLWGIGALNLILVIIIIVVAVRIARK